MALKWPAGLRGSQEPGTMGTWRCWEQPLADSHQEKRDLHPNSFSDLNSWNMSERGSIWPWKKTWVPERHTAQWTHLGQPGETLSRESLLDSWPTEAYVIRVCCFKLLFEVICHATQKTNTVMMSFGDLMKNGNLSLAKLSETHDLNIISGICQTLQNSCMSPEMFQEAGYTPFFIRMAFLPVSAVCNVNLSNFYFILNL